MTDQPSSSFELHLDTWLRVPQPLSAPLKELPEAPLEAFRLAHIEPHLRTLLESVAQQEALLGEIHFLLKSHYLHRASIIMRFIAGPHQGRREQIQPGATLTLGRGQDCDIILMDERASRHHARLQQKDQQLRVEDLGSRNGVLLNGNAIEESATLIHEDRLLIGDSVIEIAIEYHHIDVTPATGEQKDTLLDDDLDLDLGLEISVATVMVEGVGDIASLINEELSDEELAATITLADNIPEGFASLEPSALEVLQLAHNLGQIEAVLMNAPSRERIPETLQIVRDLIGLGFLEQHTPEAL